MKYLNKFTQLSQTAVDSLYDLVKDMINKNTTNILEVGTYAGQATVKLCGAANEKSQTVQVISIDDNNDAFSPSAEDSLRASNFRNYSVQSGEIDKRFEENIVKANIIYIDRFHEEIDAKIELIKRNIIVPTKVIFRNPKNSSDFPFDISEYSPEVKPRARKKSVAETQSVSATTSTTASTKVTTKENKKETT